MENNEEICEICGGYGLVSDANGEEMPCLCQKIAENEKEEEPDE